MKKSPLSFGRTPKRKGSSSILVIMIVLMLVIFGVLSTISAYSSYKLSEKNANYTNLCYELDSQAQEIKALGIEKMQVAAKAAMEFSKDRGQVDNRRIYMDRLERELSTIETPKTSEFNVSQNTDTKNILLNCVLTEEYPSGNERFSFEMNFPYPEKPVQDIKDVDYHILSWKKIPKEMVYKEEMDFQDIETNTTGGTK